MSKLGQVVTNCVWIKLLDKKLEIFKLRPDAIGLTQFPDYISIHVSVQFFCLM